MKDLLIVSDKTLKELFPRGGSQNKFTVRERRYSACDGKLVFRTNDRNVLKIWLDLNNMKIGRLSRSQTGVYRYYDLEEKNF